MFDSIAEAIVGQQAHLEVRVGHESIELAKFNQVVRNLVEKNVEKVVNLFGEVARPVELFDCSEKFYLRAI